MSWICKGGKDEYLVEMDAIRQLEMQKILSQRSGICCFSFMSSGKKYK